MPRRTSNLQTVETSGLDSRAQVLLAALIKEHLITGEAVGSRVLSDRFSHGYGWSPATIRNLMSDLAETGYLEQPHTSAGRVPTAQAFRYYVEQLSGKARLAPADEGIIRDSLHGISDVQEFMERTSHVLSLISHNLGVAVASAGPKNALDHVYFSRLGDRKVLAVVVTKSGLVRDRVLRLERELAQSDLELASRYINQNFRGWTMDALSAEIGRRIERERSEYDRLMQSVEQLYRRGALDAPGAEPAIFLEGEDGKAEGLAALAVGFVLAAAVLPFFAGLRVHPDPADPWRLGPTFVLLLCAGAAGTAAVVLAAIAASRRSWSGKVKNLSRQLLQGLSTLKQPSRCLMSVSFGVATVTSMTGSSQGTSTSMVFTCRKLLPYVRGMWLFTWAIT